MATQMEKLPGARPVAFACGLVYSRRYALRVSRPSGRPCAGDGGSGPTPDHLPGRAPDLAPGRAIKCNVQFACENLREYIPPAIIAVAGHSPRARSGVWAVRRGLNKQQGMHAKRINLRLLTRLFLLVLVLPCSAAIAVDLLAGTLPFITIAAIVICFPTAAILLSRAALRELDRVYDEIAPPALPPTEPGVDAS